MKGVTLAAACLATLGLQGCELAVLGAAGLGYLASRDEAS